MSETSYRNEVAEHLVREYVRTRNSALQEKIVAEYRDMVTRIARKYSGLEMQEDLVQVGLIGLLNALNMYEPDKGVRFNTYATHLVAGAIKHHLRDKTKIIREPAWLQEIRHRVNRMSAMLLQENGRVPTPEEISEKSEIPLETVREILATDELFRVTSLTSTATDDDDESEEIEYSDDCMELLDFEDRELIASAISGLRELEQKVILLFHFESMNQSEIAEYLKISGNYVSHILRQAHSKLRVFFMNHNKMQNLLSKTSDDESEILDELTGIYTAEYMISRLNEMCTLASTNNESLGCILIDFKGVHELQKFYGTDAIHHFLKGASSFLVACVRRLDIVGRFGETGFMIILPASGSQVNLVTNRLKSRISQWIEDSARNAGVSVLIGEAQYPLNGRNAKSLIQSAKLQPFEYPKAA